MAEWELSKENIQPLKNGRKVSTLNTVLQARDEETQKALEEERDLFETEIRSYAGADPIDPWYRYINWVQQSFPKGGKEGNIHILLQKCIKLFKDDKKSNFDPRYLEIWLKYAIMAVDPLEVYSFMFNNGVCTQQAGLYDAWAWHLETQNNYKSAALVYQKGRDAITNVEERDGLVLRKSQFEARISRRLNGEEIPQEEIDEQMQRSALGRLRAHGKHGKVSSLRVGTSKLGGPGTVFSGQVKQPLKPNNGGIKIFQDNQHNSTGDNRPSEDPIRKNIPSKEDYKENNMSAGKWNTFKGSKIANIPINKISEHVKPSFVLHEDEEDCKSTVTPHKVVPGESNVLSVRKLDKSEAGSNCPVALFEPPDATKRPMYCKHKVYQGAKEFSFEEMRAVTWRKIEKKRLENIEIERKRNELLEMENKIKNQQDQLKDRQVQVEKAIEEFKRMMSKNKELTNADDQRASNVSIAMTDQQSVAESLSKKNYPDDTSSLINANSNGCEKIDQCSPYRNKTASFPSSPTVNTKEALAAMQQIWAENDTGDNAAAPVILNPSKELDSQGYTNQNKFHIFEDSQPIAATVNTLPFEIFSDSELKDRTTTRNKPKKVFNFDKENLVDKDNFADKANPGCQENLFDKENLINNKEDGENIPPQGYTQSKVNRTKTGVLTPSENIEWMPLEEQERLLDEAERKQEISMSLPKPVIGNATMLVPDEREFGNMAKTASTPFTGMGFVPMEDEDTCAVQLVYRHQELDSLVMPPPADDEPMQLAPLSPIVETSREHYKSSSSSSSGADTTNGTTRGDQSKSRWGNTGVSSHQKTIDNTTGICLKSTSEGLLTSCSSGYVGDKSSMYNCNANTLSLQPRNMLSQERPSTTAPDDDLFSDMMSEYKLTLQKPIVTNNQLEVSMQPSFIDVAERERSDYMIATPALHGISVGLVGESPTNRDLPQGLDNTEMVDLKLDSKSLLCTTTSKSMLGAPVLNLTNASVNISNPHLLSMSADISKLQSYEASSAVERLGDLTGDVKRENLVQSSVDPFSLKTQEDWLSEISVPVDKRHGYIKIGAKIPRITIGSCIQLGEDRFTVTALKGEGGFAKVYSAIREGSEMDCTIAGIDAVLKVQRPANEWEWYICTEVEQRISNSSYRNFSQSFMSIPRSYSFTDGSVFVSYHQKLGNFLELINTTKAKQNLSTETLALYYTIEILYIVEALHSIGIVHSDLKPDNFLLKDFPRVREGSTKEEVFNFSSTSLQLIDFGRAIDLSILPEGTTFNQVVKTDGLKCVEMREGRGWREHLDYYGIAACAYCMLFGNYMDIVKSKGVWEVKGSYRRNFVATDLWKKFFHQFINIESSDKESLPSLKEWREKLMARFFQHRAQMCQKINQVIEDITSS